VVLIAKVVEVMVVMIVGFDLALAVGVATCPFAAAAAAAVPVVAVAAGGLLCGAGGGRQGTRVLPGNEPTHPNPRHRTPGDVEHENRT